MPENTPTIEEALGVSAPERQNSATPESKSSPEVRFTDMDSLIDDPMADLEEDKDISSMVDTLDAPAVAPPDRGIVMDEDYVSEGERTEEPVDEGSAEGDVRLTQEEYEQLLSRVEGRLSGAEGAPEAPPEAPHEAPQASPVPVDFASMELPPFEISEDLAEDMGLSSSARKSFNAQMSTAMKGYSEKIAAAAFGMAMQQMGPAVINGVNSYAPLAVAAYHFDKENPEYRKVPNLVREAMLEEMKASPDTDPLSLFENVKSRISYAAKKARKMANKDAVSKQVAPQPGTAGRRAPARKLSKEEEMMRDMAMFGAPVDPEMDMF